MSQSVIPEGAHLQSESSTGPVSLVTVPATVLIDVGTRGIRLEMPPAHEPSIVESAVHDATAEPRIALGTGSQRSKRTFDVFVTMITAVVWLPVLAIAALLVKMTSRGPVFYAQERIGRDGKRFRCLKLRTMAVDAELKLEELLQSDLELRSEYEAGFKLRRDPRVTKLGRLLRRSGLDELPQLFLVLSGTMSLVGPRPIVAGETMLYGPYRPIVESLRPGLTGLWQVSGRNDVSYASRVAYDVQYALTHTLWLDTKLLCKTAAVTFDSSRRGSY